MYDALRDKGYFLEILGSPLTVSLFSFILVRAIRLTACVFCSQEPPGKFRPTPVGADADGNQYWFRTDTL